MDDNHGALMHVVRLRTGRVNCTRDRFTAHLKSEWGVGTVIHYPAVFSWEVMRNAGYTAEGCPEAEKACAQVFSLPIFAATTEEEITYIAHSLNETIAAMK